MNQKTGKHSLAIFLITVVSSFAFSLLLSTETQGASEVRTTQSGLYCAMTKTSTYTENDHSERQRVSEPPVSQHTEEAPVTVDSHNPPAARGEVSARDRTEEVVPTRHQPAKEQNDATAADSAEHVSTTTQQPAVATLERTVKPITTSEGEVTPVDLPERTERDGTVEAAKDNFISELTDEIHRLTNNEREQAGLPALVYDSALTTIAEQHSQDMAQNDYFSHIAQNGCDLDCRFQAGAYDALAWGENIAWRSSSDALEAKEVAAFFVVEWMNSDGHRRNLLSDSFTHEGIGLARIGNKVYATVNFAEPR